MNSPIRALQYIMSLKSSLRFTPKDRTAERMYKKLVATLCDGDINFYLRNQVTLEEMESLVLKHL